MPKTVDQIEVKPLTHFVDDAYTTRTHTHAFVYIRIRISNSFCRFNQNIKANERQSNQIQDIVLICELHQSQMLRICCHASSFRVLFFTRLHTAAPSGGGFAITSSNVCSFYLTTLPHCLCVYWRRISKVLRKNTHFSSIHLFRHMTHRIDVSVLVWPISS